MPFLGHRNLVRTSLKCQGLARHEHDVGSLVLAFHLVLPVVRGLCACRPLRSRRVVQAGRLVIGAVDVSGADDAVAVGHCKVEQTCSVDVLVL